MDGQNSQPMGNIARRLAVGSAAATIAVFGTALLAPAAGAVEVAPAPVTVGPVTVTVGGSVTPDPSALATQTCDVVWLKHEYATRSPSGDHEKDTPRSPRRRTPLPSRLTT